MSTTERAVGSKKLVHRFSTVAALLAGLGYLGWRLTTLGSGPVWLSLPMFALELWGYALLAGMLYRAWPRSSAPTASSLVRQEPTQPEADVVITAGACDVAQLERTLIGCDGLPGVSSVTVIEGRVRSEVADLCAAFGVQYRTDGGTTGPDSLGVVLADGAAGFVLWLDGGEIPLSTAATASLHRMAANPDNAIVQLGRQLQNADSLVNLSRGGDPENIEDRVFGPSLGAAGAAPWLGSGSLIRREAMHSIPGWSPGDSSALDRAAIQLHRQGWRTVHDASPLIGIQAPRSLGAYLGYRRRLALTSYRFLASSDSPALAAGISLRYRLFHLAGALQHTAGLRQLGIVALIVVVLVSGQLPLEAPVTQFVGWWFPYWLLAVDAKRLATNGLYGRGDSIRNAWRGAEAELSALRAVLVGTGRGPIAYRHRSSLGSMRSPVAALIALNLAMLARAATFLNEDLLPTFSATGRIIVLGVALAAMFPLVDVLQLTARRRQRRKSHRVVLDRTVRFGDQVGRSIDITVDGIAIRDVTAKVGEQQNLSLSLPMGEASCDIEVQGIVRFVLDTDEGVRVGLEFANLDRPTRRRLVEFCLYASGRRRKSQPVITVAELDPTPPLRRLSGVLSLVGAVAGLTVMFAGPGAASSPPLAAGSICLTDSTGQPLPGAEAQYDNGGWVTIGVTNETGCAEGLIPQMREGSFRVTHEGRRNTITQDSFTDTTVEFATVPVTISISDERGQPIPQASVEFEAEGWRLFGVTDGSGTASKELLGEATDFRVAYGDHEVTVSQDTASDHLVDVVVDPEADE